MSQVIFSTIDPSISGITLATDLNNFKDALMSGLSGTSRPTELDIGGGWVDTTNDPVSWSFRIWSGTTDIEVFKINLSTQIASVALAVEQFSVKKVSADTVGAVLNLVKQRIATSGQVLSGDVVGEIRFTGRTNTSGNPVVAKIIWTAGENQTTSNSGGTLSFQSIPVGSNTLAEYMKFAASITELVLPAKINSIRYAAASYATSGTSPTTGEISLPVTKSLIEITGSFDLLVRGIIATGNAQEITIHNKTSNTVTLKHQDSAATSANRLFLPNLRDYLITANSSATLYYSVADSQWKLKSISQQNFVGFTVNTYTQYQNTFTALSTTGAIRVKAYRQIPGFTREASQLQDPYGALYAWGINTADQLGDGTVVPKSSPVAVLSGVLGFNKTFGVTSSTGQTRYGIANNGKLYSWGFTANGQSGAGTVTALASPTLVLGGLSFVNVVARENAAWALGPSGFLYGFGVNTNGQLGVGNVTPQSSPVAVLGGFRFGKVFAGSGTTANSASVYALDSSGAMYAFGLNLNGQLGLGNVTPQSSPVAVLGGQFWNEVAPMSNGANLSTLGLNTSGILYAWGDNGNGQLGLGDVTPRSSPVAVLGGLTISKIESHYKGASAYALDSSGNVYAWGINDKGQLGTGDVASKSSPIAVVGGLQFASLKIFQKSAFGLTSAGALYAWGDNTNGQLGLGDVIARSSPVAVLGGLTFKAVYCAEGSTDFYSMFGITPQGVVYAWGANANGTLALGDVVPRSSPVAILGSVTPDILENVYDAYLTVIPGQSYPVVISDAISYFGSQSLGPSIKKIEVEYL